MAWPSEILNRAFNAAARALNVKIVDGAGVEKFTDMNPGSMQLTGSIPAIKKSIKTLNHSITGANIPVGGTNLLTITPPVGELWRLLQMNITISPPAGATTGEHSVEAYLYNYVSVPFFRVISNYDKYISIAFNRPASTQSKSFFPDTIPEFMSQIKGIKTTNTIPLNLLYKNNTDVPQENLAIGVTCYWEVDYIG